MRNGALEVCVYWLMGLGPMLVFDCVSLTRMAGMSSLVKTYCFGS